MDREGMRTDTMRCGVLVVCSDLRAGAFFVRRLSASASVSSSLGKGTCLLSFDFPLDWALIERKGATGRSSSSSKSLSTVLVLFSSSVEYIRRGCERMEVAILALAVALDLDEEACAAGLALE